jgi:hypothetical protein
METIIKCPAAYGAQRQAVETALSVYKRRREVYLGLTHTPPS